MEDVLSLYELPYDTNEPVLCFDEKSKELHGETRATRPTQEARVRRRDYEYKRNGTRNIFMTVEPKGGYRDTAATARRARTDFAEEIKRIAALPRYADAARIHIVLDNLNTHDEKSLVVAFGEKNAAILMQRVQFHHTPKHASWLNMAEIELSIMEGQCTKGRIGDASLLDKKLQTWQTERNKAGSTISWTFTRADARMKFKYGTELY